MKKRSLLFTLLACLFTIGQAKDYSDYVNPLVGTQSTFELSTGNTYPAIARPWGMNFWTPQTGKMGDGWQYTYTATKIRGFMNSTKTAVQAGSRTKEKLPKLTIIKYI